MFFIPNYKQAIQRHPGATVHQAYSQKCRQSLYDESTRCHNKDFHIGVRVGKIRRTDLWRFLGSEPEVQTIIVICTISAEGLSTPIIIVICTIFVQRPSNNTISATIIVKSLITVPYWQSTQNRNHSAAATRGIMEPPAARFSGLLSIQQLMPQLKTDREI